MRKLLPWLMFAVATTFYSYELVIRIMPSIMIPELASAFSLSSRKIGLLSSSFYSGYLITTLVSGLCLDYFGIRRVMLTACSLCVFGMFAFTFSQHALMAEFSRLLMGAGAAFAFIGTMKVGFDWLPHNWLGRLIGIITFTGMCAAVIGQSSLGYFITIIDWHTLSLILSCLGLVVLFLFIITLRDKPESIAIMSSETHFNDIIHSTRTVLANNHFWLLGIIGLFTYIPIAGFADLWCVSYLQASYNLTREMSAYYSSMIFLGWGLGGPFFGVLSDHYHDWRKILSYGTSFAALSIALPIYSTVQVFWLPILLFALGFFASSHIVVFIGAKHLGSKNISATIVALINFLVMLSGALIQPLIGLLLDLYGSYTLALSVLPIGLVFSMYLSSHITDRRDVNLAANTT